MSTPSTALQPVNTGDYCVIATAPELPYRSVTPWYKQSFGRGTRKTTFRSNRGVTLAVIQDDQKTAHTQLKEGCTYMVTHEYDRDESRITVDGYMVGLPVPRGRMSAFFTIADMGSELVTCYELKQWESNRVKVTHGRAEVTPVGRPNCSRTYFNTDNAGMAAKGRLTQYATGT